jgi:hypothetical protein
LNDAWKHLAAKPKPQVPESVEAVWTSTTLYQPGQAATRGFGGRVMFHGKDQDRSLLVDGNVVVYAFDDDHPDPKNPKPLKKFVFPAEDLAKHQSESALGPSYSFWLPWDPVGGQQRRISLITRFEDASGAMIASSIAHVTLPGETAAAEQASLKTPHGAGRTGDPAAAQIRSASFETPAATSAADTARTGKMSTTTIDIAPDQARRLLAGHDARETNAGRVSQPVTDNPLANPEQPVPDLPPRDAPAVRSALEQSPAPGSATAPRAFERVRKRPPLGESLHRLPPTPRSGWNRSAPASSADDAPARD